MSGEWKAWDTVSSRLRTPSAARLASRAFTAPISPETTTLSGPLTAATDTRPFDRRSDIAHALLVREHRRHDAVAGQGTASAARAPR